MGHGLKAAALAVLLAASMPTSAAMVDRGGGMIYDDVLNVTWLQDANFAATQWTNSGARRAIRTAG
jgi:hypothetical protein